MFRRQLVLPRAKRAARHRVREQARRARSAVQRVHLAHAAENAADPASAHPHQARQLAKPESSEASQCRSSKAGHLLPNVVGRQRDDRGRARMLAKVEQGRFRSRIATEHLSVSGSARRLRWAQVNGRRNVAEGRRLDFVNR